MKKFQERLSTGLALFAITIAVGATVPRLGLAATPEPASAGATTTDTLRISVKGMVCSFCAQGLKKKFGAEAGVMSVDVKLKDRTVTLTGEKGKLPPAERIVSLVKESGFNLDRIELNGAAVGWKEDDDSSSEHHGSHGHSGGGGHDHDGHH